MNIERKKSVMEWGALDVNLFGVQKNWQGEALENPVGFAFAIDPKYFWFIATCQTPAMPHPEAKHGEFKSELWKYDVAEFFLKNHNTGRYLEFNLAANASWWAAEFTGPREGMGQAPLDGVETYCDVAESGAWMAAARFDLQLMYDRFCLCPDTTMNAAFILHSPDQQFASAIDLPGEHPDFHQPDHFKQVHFFNSSDLPS
ncbi:hypothetical protein OAB00_04025 [Akkermansiaceae bacterium]|nr:hypothetical protein [Akkermansiaceae bacterium]